MYTNPMFLRHAVENQERAAQLAAESRLFRDLGYLEESTVYQEQAARRARWAMEDSQLIDGPRFTQAE